MVIVGGGFAGLNAAKRLRRAPVTITLIDRSNYHLFQPLLYQVATGGLSPADIASPIRYILRRQQNARVILDTVSGVDLGNRIITTNHGTISYDSLILATGASHHYFGHDEWEQYAPGLKTLRDATEIRAAIFEAFESAERTGRTEHLTFAVVGGGPTGAELAGTIAETARHTLRKDFRSIDAASARVLLIEATPQIFNTYSEQLQVRALQQLEKLGVEVMVGWRVTGIGEDSVTITDGTSVEKIVTAAVMWAAGVKASPLAAQLGLPADQRDSTGRIIVTDQLAIANHPEVFVVGDLAHIESDGRPLPGVAPAAIQTGIYAAAAIVSSLKCDSVAPYEYRDKGSMATIGRRSGIAEFRKLRLSGWPAWATWLAVHLWFLIGFENRALVMMQWAWNYVSRNRSARLIVRYRN